MLSLFQIGGEVNLDPRQIVNALKANHALSKKGRKGFLMFDCVMALGHQVIKNRS
jgi:hypothetical protein